MVQKKVPWLQKWSVFSEALDSCNGLTSEVWWGEKLSMTLVHYSQWFCSVKLEFTDVFSLCRDVWNGDRTFPATWGEIVLQMDHSCGTSLYSHSENTFRPSRRFWFISQQNVSHHTIYDKMVYLPFSMYLFLFWRPALSVVLLFSWKTYILSLMCFLSCNFLGLHVILLLNVI